MGLARPTMVLWCVGAAVFFFAVFETMGGGMSWTTTLTQHRGRPSLKQHVALAEKIWEKTVMQRHQKLEAWDPTRQSIPYFPFREDYGKAATAGLPFTMWELIPPSFSCPYEVERVGTMADGGKWVCGMSVYESLPLGKPCIIYSLGVSSESSFEEEILSRTHCKMWAYDYTVDKFGPQVTEKHLDRAKFTKAGIGEKTDTTKSPPFYTLADLMKVNGHNYIDILKIDVEWAEYKSLAQFAVDFPAANGDFPIGQILIEIHFHGEETMSGADFIKWWEVLEDRGLRATWSELNLLVATRGGLPQFSEYTLVNVKDRRNVLFSGMQ